MTTDTIVAISTGMVPSAIGIMKISGKKSLAILKKISNYKNNITPRYLKKIKIYNAKKQVIDDCLYAFMPGPNSYTGEDVIEFFCHGSLPILKSILETCIQYGARLATPGEFTKRAFLNGKIDLTQAESIQELIFAKTNLAARLANKGVHGYISSSINNFRDKILYILSHLEASIDFPDEINFKSDDKCLQDIDHIIKEIDKLLSRVDTGKIIQRGFSVAIVGKPNVGKSTLLNQLLEEERVITSPFPGTTRDTIEAWLNIEGIPVRFIDTAGLHDTKDPIERKGIMRTKEAIKTANMIILLLDASEKTNNIKETLAFLFNKQSKTNVIKAWNKTDIAKPKTTIKKGELSISAKTGKGLFDLKSKIKQLAFSDNKKINEDELILSNQRQYQKLIIAKKSLQRGIEALEKSMPLECLAIDLKEAVTALGEITGQNVSEEVIDNIFKNFCVGK